MTWSFQATSWLAFAVRCAIQNRLCLKANQVAKLPTGRAEAKLHWRREFRILFDPAPDRRPRRGKSRCNLVICQVPFLTAGACLGCFRLGLSFTSALFWPFVEEIKLIRFARGRHQILSHGVRVRRGPMNSALEISTRALGTSHPRHASEFRRENIRLLNPS